LHRNGGMVSGARYRCSKKTILRFVIALEMKAIRCSRQAAS